MKLYAAATACSWAVEIALEVSGLAYEIDWIGANWKLRSGRNFQDVNPRLQVPALELDSGEIFTETMVLLQIVADRAPQSGLAPPLGTIERYRMLEMLSFLATEFHKHALWPLSNVENYPAPAEPLRAMLVQRLRSRLDYLEGRCPVEGFFMGPQFGLVDAFLAVMLRWGERRADGLTDWPLLSRYHARLHEHPVVAATLEINLRERARLAEAGVTL